MAVVSLIDFKIEVESVNSAQVKVKVTCSSVGFTDAFNDTISTYFTIKSMEGIEITTSQTNYFIGSFSYNDQTEKSKIITFDYEKNTTNKDKTLTIDYTLREVTKWSGTVESEQKTLEIEIPPIQYILTYNANGGDQNTVPADQTAYYNGIIKISNTIPTRTGYRFKCWNTGPELTGTTSSYNPGDTRKMNDNLTLYAIWSQIQNILLPNDEGKLIWKPCNIKIYHNGDWRDCNIHQYHDGSFN